MNVVVRMELEAPTRAAPTMMDSLPNEIIRTILEKVLYIPDPTFHLWKEGWPGYLYVWRVSRHASILRTCSRWYELGMPFLLQTIVHDRGNMGTLMLEKLLLTLQRRPDLAVHLRRLFVMLIEKEHIVLFKDILSLAGPHITTIGCVMAYLAEEQDYITMFDALQCVRPVAAMVHGYQPFPADITRELLGEWRRAGLHDLFVKIDDTIVADVEYALLEECLSDVDSIPNLHLMVNGPSHWPFVEGMVKKTTALTVCLNPFFRIWRGLVYEAWQHSPDELKAVIQIL